MNDRQVKPAGVIGYRDHFQFDPSIIQSEVEQLIADEDWFTGVDHRGEDMSVSDPVLAPRPCDPHPREIIVSYTYETGKGLVLRPESAYTRMVVTG